MAQRLSKIEITRKRNTNRSLERRVRGLVGGNVLGGSVSQRCELEQVREVESTSVPDVLDSRVGGGVERDALAGCNDAEHRGSHKQMTHL